MLVVVLDGTFHKTNEKGLLGNVPQSRKKVDITRNKLDNYLLSR